MTLLVFVTSCLCCMCVLVQVINLLVPYTRSVTVLIMLFPLGTRLDRYSMHCILYFFHLSELRALCVC
jgi:hypothetical protein